MNFAINGPDWIELQPGRDVIIDDVASSYDTVQLWSPQMRSARGIKPIVEAAIPAGKVATGSTLIDDDGFPLRVWTLADPPTPPVPQEVTETQFIRACVQLGIITAAEGKAYLARGELPAAMTAALAVVPEAQRDDAELKVVGSASFSRTDGVFAAIVASGVATSEQVDAVFRLAASLD